MDKERLAVVEISEELQGSPQNSKKNRREEQIAKMERMWLINPEQFDPNRTQIGRTRLSRTLSLIKKNFDLKDSRVIDLGCGNGTLSRLYRDEGARVTALDAANNALKAFTHNGSEQIKLVQDCLPALALQETSYDLVSCCDVIAFLPQQQWRLLTSELSRLASKDGWIVCSTPFDTRTEGALELFNQLMETEIDIKEWSFSYHRLLLSLVHLFSAPQRFEQGHKDKEAYENEIKNRSWLSKKWYECNTSRPLCWVWGVIALVTSPILSLLKGSPSVMRFCESITRFYWDTAGISHAILIGKKKPLLMPPPPAELPRELKQKRFVWE